MLKTMFQIKPLLFKSQTEDGDTDASAPNSSESSPSSSPFDWMTKKRSLSLTFDRSGPVPVTPTPTKDSPVKTVVNLIEDLRKDMELALRFRDVFILEEDDRFLVLQVVFS